MLSQSKYVVRNLSQEDVLDAFGFEEAVTVPGVNIMPDGETVIHLKKKRFDYPGDWERKIIVQKCVVVANKAGKLLTTQYTNRIGKFLTTMSGGDMLYQDILAKFLPHIQATTAEMNTINDFGVLSRIKSDQESGLLLLGRAIRARHTWILNDEVMRSGNGRRILSWEDPEDLLWDGTFSPAQRSILLWYLRQN